MYEEGGLKMNYEVFVGASGKKYYVIPTVNAAREIKEELRGKLKVKESDLHLIGVWIERGVVEKDGVYDYLWTERRKGAEKMVAFITPGRKRKGEE